jgi:hypothetical protein
MLLQAQQQPGSIFGTSAARAGSAARPPPAQQATAGAASARSEDPRLLAGIKLVAFQQAMALSQQQGLQRHPSSLLATSAPAAAEPQQPGPGFELGQQQPAAQALAARAAAAPSAAPPAAPALLVAMAQMPAAGQPQPTPATQGLQQLPGPTAPLGADSQRTLHMLSSLSMDELQRLCPATARALADRLSSGRSDLVGQVLKALRE